MSGAQGRIALQVQGLTGLYRCKNQWAKKGRESRDGREESVKENSGFDCRLVEFKMPLPDIFFLNQELV